ncbi:DUF2971 domain-containing protein [Carboxylicivirga taeanensis]|uniref:DUF2971 domain-containing protein n=1 Tax=Carboxylicivirga taeanensis TaxID=1416875 RepID=UPI003F6E2DE6
MNDASGLAPRWFTDPFDCRIPPYLESLDTKEKTQAYVDGIIVRNFEHLKNSGKDIKVLMDSYTARLTNNLEKEQEFANKILFNGQDLRLGVLSMSKKWDSILMWSHYGDFHKGICYGFNEEKMRNSEKFCGGGIVKYRNDFPKLDPLEKQRMKNSFIQTHTKAKKWKYEKEYRFFKYFNKNTDPKSTDRKVFYSDDHLEEVVLGVDFPSDQIATVKQVTHSKGIPLYKAEKVSCKFKIERREIK